MLQFYSFGKQDNQVEYLNFISFYGMFFDVYYGPIAGFLTSSRSIYLFLNNFGSKTQSTFFFRRRRSIYAEKRRFENVCQAVSDNQHLTFVTNPNPAIIFQNADFFNFSTYERQIVLKIVQNYHIFGEKKTALIFGANSNIK